MNEELRKRAEKAASAVYLACDASVADDISGIIRDLLAALTREPDAGEVERVGEVKRIPLPNDRYTLVDAEDYDYFSQWNWSVHSDGYAHRNLYTGRKATGNIRLHRAIIKAQPDQIVDHINRDKLDNRKSNLRICASGENRANSGLNRNNKAGLKGVHKKVSRYIARHKRVDLGRFDDAIDAAKCYDAALTERFGHYAATNENLGLIRKYQEAMPKQGDIAVRMYQALYLAERSMAAPECDKVQALLHEFEEKTGYKNGKPPVKAGEAE